MKFTNGMKYVIFVANAGGEETPMLLPKELEFTTAKENFGHIGPIISAGMLEYDEKTKRITAHGESKDLGLKARPKDGKLIQDYLTEKGVYTGPKRS